jgi:hypothetical protein
MREREPFELPGTICRIDSGLLASLVMVLVVSLLRLLMIAVSFVGWFLIPTISIVPAFLGHDLEGAGLERISKRKEGYIFLYRGEADDA